MDVFVSYSTTEVGIFTPLCSSSLRSTAPEDELHDVLRAGSRQPLTAGYTRSLVDNRVAKRTYKPICDSSHGSNH
ncbi:MAG: hypothetical protein ACTSVF_01870, partial [Candidatus Asgardarchaeia archaeon]